MRLLAMSLLTSLSLSAHAATDWERWLASPTAPNAQKVRAIEYSGNTTESEAGVRITRDLRALANRVHAGDPASLRLALKLTDTTAPGANLEDLHEMIGSAVKPHARKVLEALKYLPELSSCPGVGFLGTNFVDQPEKRQRELAARTTAIESVTEPSMARQRAQCLATLKGDA